MEQLSREMSEVVMLESLNAQRIEKLYESMDSMRDTISNSIGQLGLNVTTQAQTMIGFRELYAREISFIHQSLSEMKESLQELKDGLLRDYDKINAVEKDIAVARGSIKGAVMSWSGFVALIALIIDKGAEIFGKK